MYRTCDQIEGNEVYFYDTFRRESENIKLELGLNLGAFRIC